MGLGKFIKNKIAAGSGANPDGMWGMDEITDPDEDTESATCEEDLDDEANRLAP
jgi:hypothetical protein